MTGLKTIYKLESDFVSDFMPIILGGLVGSGRKISYHCEVPRFSHNNHSDIILIMNKKVLVIEFKLSDYKGLLNQLSPQNKIRTIGILNRRIKKDKPLQYSLFEYTGQDSEIDRIIQSILKIEWTDIYNSELASIYYWGYLNEENDFNGGLRNCNRLSFFQLYKRAIENLMEFYGTPDFYLIYRVLGFYSKATAMKHYKELIKENKVIRLKKLLI